MPFDLNPQVKMAKVQLSCWSIRRPSCPDSDDVNRSRRSCEVRSWKPLVQLKLAPSRVLTGLRCDMGTIEIEFQKMGIGLVLNM